MTSAFSLDHLTSRRMIWERAFGNRLHRVTEYGSAASATFPFDGITHMKPPHPVWKSKLATLAWVINKAIDNGNYDLPIADVRKAADEERVIQFIRDSLPTHRLLDISLLTPDDEAAINHRFLGLNGNHDIHIDKQGLCLLLAWIIEMMQHAGDPEDIQ